MKKQSRVATIGGQALLEGVMMRGKTSMALAVRSSNNQIVIESTRLKPKTKWRKIPIIRGILAFVDSLVTGVSTMMKSAEFLEEEPSEQLSKGWAAFAVVAGLLLGVAGFMVLPNVVSELMAKYLNFKSNILLRSVISGGLRLVLFIAYLALVSLMNDIKRTFMYHGAEHRTIACFEAGERLAVKNVQKFSTRHDRCGTTFLFLVMVVSIILNMFLTWAIVKVGIPDEIYFNIPIKLAFLPIVAGISYELLFLLAKLPDNLFVRILKAPGLSLQRLTTKQPDDEMAVVAIRAFRCVEFMDNDPSLPAINKGEYYLKQLIDEMCEIFNIDNLEGESKADAEFIIAEVLGVKRNAIYNYKVINAESYNKAVDFAKKRNGGVPLSQVLGNTVFYGLKLKVSDKVLSPRPETELLAEQVINAVKSVESMEHRIKVLDLCTGSGCIAIAVYENCGAEITASDISEDAIAVAKENIGEREIALIQSDLFENIDGKFDIIVSNPPYIMASEMESLDPQVKNFDPHIALCGGEDGLDFYRSIAASAKDYLNKSGKLFLEVGAGQAETVTMLLKDFDIKIIKDYQGIDRIILATQH